MKLNKIQKKLIYKSLDELYNFSLSRTHSSSYRAYHRKNINKAYHDIIKTIEKPTLHQINKLIKDEYIPKKFDFSKKRIHFSNPPKEYGLGLCFECKSIIESKDWKNLTVFCEGCKKEKAKNG